MGLFRKYRNNAEQRRAIVIGLDGTPFTLARGFIEDGTMPNLAQIVRNGTLSQMDTSIPDISSVAWTSFMTGANPGRHGVFGFLDLQPNSYKIYFPNSRHIKCETLWDAAGRSNRRSIVVNVPSTYPARPLNGVLVSGFVAVDINKAAYPTDYVAKLQAMDYRIDVDARKVQQSHDALMEDILKTLERRVEVILRLFDDEQWDMFIGVVTETDRLQHFFMDAAQNPSHKYWSAFLDFYRRVDDFLGRIAERLRGETLFIMSDHGFTTIERQVYLNRWLMENGYLKLRENARSIEDIAAGSIAFALDPGRIYLNVKGRYPAGTVDVADSEKILEELKQGLQAISVNGMPVVKRIYDRDELFSGPSTDSAPDLCVQSHYGYDLKGAVNKRELADREVFTGMHTQDDATLFVSVPSADLRSARPHITDVAPTILESIGSVPPSSMDGHSLFRPQ